MLLAGAPGAEPGRVLVIGCGVVGSNAVEIAVGMGAEVIVLDRDQKILDSMDEKYSGKVKTIFSNESDLVSEVLNADLVIGAVLLPGAKAPKLVNKKMVSEMKPGSVIVDVAIDQGGCVETAHPTTHSDPTFVIDGVVHYCVANMPGAVPRTATISLTNTILPYVLTLASEGVRGALVSNPNFLNGLNVCAGKICEPSVSETHNLDYIYPLASSLYGATKGATHVLSMDLRLELQGTGVRVTEICPGRVTTEFYDAALDDHAMVESKKNSGIKEVTSEDI